MIKSLDEKCRWNDVSGMGSKRVFFYLSLLASHLLSASLCLINTHPHNELWLNAVHLLLVARETDRCFTGLWNYSLVWFLLRKNIFLCISFSLKIREKSLKSLFITKTSTIKDWVWNISQQVHDFVSKQERNFAICGIFIVVQKKGNCSITWITTHHLIKAGFSSSSGHFRVKLFKKKSPTQQKLDHEYLKFTQEWYQADRKAELHKQDVF